MGSVEQFHNYLEQNSSVGYGDEDRDRIKIFVGAGTCGLGAGAGKTILKIKDYIDRNSIEADIVKVGCIGLCSVEPLVDIKFPARSRVSFYGVVEDKVEQLFDSMFRGDFPSENMLGQFDDDGEKYSGIEMIDEHPFFKNQKRIVLKNCGKVNPESIEDYLRKGGFASLYKAVTETSPMDLCRAVEKSGLRGRGGGGFLTGLKWKFAAGEEADQKYLICNADEGDPGAFMDRAVIEGDPFKLIEGMAIAAYGIGATKAYIYIRAEYPLAIKRLEKAIELAEKHSFLGENVFGAGFNLEIIIKMGAGAFVCGEETALIHSIEGKRGMPRPRPPYPAKSGLFGKPTIINNVETFSNLPGIVENGSEWFASMGTEKSKGSKVFALSGKVKYTGLIEVEMGTTVREIIFDMGGGVEGGKKFKAAQIGGPSGGCIPESHLDIAVDYDQLKTVGAMMGSGGLVVMDEDTCMVDVAKFFMDFIQRESCGKCIPCREGTKRMLEILEMLTKGRNSGTQLDSLKRIKGMMNLEPLAKVIKETSLCGLGQTAPNPVLSTLKWFKAEYEEHLYERRCDAGVCKELIKYSVVEAKCKGCTLCAKRCPAKAILGTPKTVHFIEDDNCIGCGECFKACPFDAISLS